MCFFTSTPPFSPLSFQSKHSTRTSFHTTKSVVFAVSPNMPLFFKWLYSQRSHVCHRYQPLSFSLSLGKVCGSEVNFVLLRDSMCHICALCWGLLAAAVILMHWLEATEVFLSALLSKSINGSRTFNSLISTRSMADKVRARIWNIQICKTVIWKGLKDNIIRFPKMFIENQP